MRRIQIVLITVLLLPSLLWWWAEASNLPVAGGFFPWRSLLIQYSGILALAAMSAAMWLAVRPVWLESMLGGLDKMYRLHKWLGISALVFAVLHWSLATVPKWLVRAGWIERPARGKPHEAGSDILEFFQSQRELAESVGEWAFYALFFLLLIALVRVFPYRYFFKTHRLLALVYLFLALHSVLLVRHGYWIAPLGIALALMLATGAGCAVISLFQRIGANHRAVGVIDSIEHLDGVSVNAVGIRLESRWPGHKAGQFAFITFDAEEGAHPFTISSAWQGDGKLLLLIKALGDYTSTLASNLKVGDMVRIEGPYGRFDFSGAAQRQIWIGGGIGITPFVARMKFLANHPDGRKIDLFHSTRDVDETALRHLADDADGAGVKLHLMIDERDGYLTGERIREKIPEWRSAEVWFCGPLTFGDAIRRDLVQHGLPEGHFHQEWFDLR